MTKKRKDRNQIVKRKSIFDILDGMDARPLILVFMLHLIAFRILADVICLPNLCLYGQFTDGTTFEHVVMRNKAGATYLIRLSYQVDGKTYTGRIPGRENNLEVCYWPKHPWIFYRGSRIRGMRSRWNITPRTSGMGDRSTISSIPES